MSECRKLGGVDGHTRSSETEGFVTELPSPKASQRQMARVDRSHKVTNTLTVITTDRKLSDKDMESELR